MPDTLHIAGDDRLLAAAQEKGAGNPASADWFAAACARLDAITAYFLETGPVREKNADDLRFELGFANDRAWEAQPDTPEITLLQLLQASAARIHAGGQDAAVLHIHHQIEHALIEQEGLRIIAALWPVTGNGNLTEQHLALLDAAVRPHLSAHGIMALNRIAERVTGRPDFRTSSALQFAHGPRHVGDPATEAAFLQAQTILDTITAHFLEGDDLWEKTPADLAYELDYHNRWGAHDAAQRGEPHTETSLQELQALSQRHLLALEETGWHGTFAHQVALFIDGLIQQALAAEQEIEALLVSAPTLKTTGMTLSGGPSAAK